ncbi:Csu type fimbrial protein [Vannielia litorea]|uniref:Spore coat protein U (SCPU) domain-containing protein n=1 Tax=Vannielia litorea TaxID=1217970 RepID=A0A1N6EAV5_9RHOB|nr:spore coat protein U domain-containing protein [Vannielia litorea]SIN80126.1 Spore coat protein U (SCPU) domain-containing protein [Vannielia litorea]
MTKFAKFACAATVGMGMSMGAAQAAEKTTNLSVNAIVLDSCTVTAVTALGFGSIDTNTDAGQTIPGLINVVCSSAKTDVSVKLGAGAASSGGSRNMSDSGSATIPYSIFSDSTHTDEVGIDENIWEGDLTAITPQNIPVYGTIAAGNYSAGIYSDTVLVTLTY